MRIELYIYLAMGVFLLIELWKPRLKVRLFTHGRLEDSIWFILNELIFTMIVGFLSYRIGVWAEVRFSAVNFSINLTALHVGIQFLIFFLIMDAISFSFHYLAHRNGLLWETHKIHHTITELTFLSAFRHSWSQKIIEQGFFAILSGWMNFDDQVRLWGNMAFVILCMFQHTNTNLKFPRFAEYFLITPRNHYWHHSKFRHKPFGQNFGLLFAHWDHLMGTWYNPEHLNSELGLNEEAVYSSYFNKVFHPVDTVLVKAIKKIFVRF